MGIINQYFGAMKTTNQSDTSTDNVYHPSHYNQHPSGIEAIQVCEHMNFNIGNAIKYLWRADYKGKRCEDLQKAMFYIQRELIRIERQNEGKNSSKGS